jgi:hypothetical protein
MLKTRFPFTVEPPAKPSFQFCSTCTSGGHF